MAVGSKVSMIDSYMAKSYFDIQIERTAGPYPKNRYGIILKHLQKLYRRFLIEHRHIKKWAQDDQFVSCVLRMQRPIIKNSSALKYYVDHESGKVLNQADFLKVNNTINWVCAISGRPIKAKFMNFDLTNFLDKEYYDVLDAPMIDSRILKSSIEFRKKCKELLLKERQEFLMLAKKNAKRNLE
jgi:hypothetical protein